MTNNRRIVIQRILAHAALAWEGLWPALVPPLSILALFLAFALLEGPTWLNGWVHLALLALFALAFAGSLLFGLRHFRRASHQQANRRLEIASGLAHRPLTALEDQLSDASDPVLRGLWRRHQARAQQQLRRLRAGWPHPGVPARDPYGFRAAALLLLFIGIAVGASDPLSRVQAALSPDFSMPAAPAARIEAWINPPDYTGVVPLRINQETAQPIKVPAGSVLLARLFGGEGDARLLLDETSTGFERLDAQNQQVERKIDQGTLLTLRQGDHEIARWHYQIVPDLPPTASSGDGPKVTGRNVMRIEYEATDDYGVVDVAATFRLADEKRVQADTQDRNPANQEGSVELRLGLPLTPGARETKDVGFHDLTAHPWAGLPVQMKIIATDGAGQTGASSGRIFRLPERIFRHPVARAIVEQRRKLALDKNQSGKVARALTAIAAAPEAFDDDIVAFLALRTAAERLLLNSDQKSLNEVQELLWDTALRIEDGGVTLAEQELRAAQRELMDALSRDGEDSEIAQLMDRLEQAMQKYLKALAEQARRLAKQGDKQQEVDRNSQLMAADDLRKMLERARELARMGARDAAREMLQRLQEMLENLQNGQMQAMTPEMREAQSNMRELGKMMDQQQELLDQTFRQGGKAPGSKGKRPGGGEGNEPSGKGARGLAERQEALRRRLGEMMRRMGEGTGSIPAPLGRAERSMRGAREALQQGRGDSAMTDQSQALEQMAEGMRELSEQMSRRMSQGGQMQSMGGRREIDPMGRPLNGTGVDTSRVRIPEQWELRRARRILQELHRRSGEFDRPSDERRYIDRLLRRF